MRRWAAAEAYYVAYLIYYQLDEPIARQATME